jgi:hypothetical protein
MKHFAILYFAQLLSLYLSFIQNERTICLLHYNDTIITPLITTYPQ